MGSCRIFWTAHAVPSSPNPARGCGRTRADCRDRHHSLQKLRPSRPTNLKNGPFSLADRFHLPLSVTPNGLCGIFVSAALGRPSGFNLPSFSWSFSRKVSPPKREPQRSIGWRPCRSARSWPAPTRAGAKCQFLLTVQYFASWTPPQTLRARNLPGGKRWPPCPLPQSPPRLPHPRRGESAR